MIHPRCCAEGIESVNVPRAEGEFENDLRTREGQQPFSSNAGIHLIVAT
jgi:hypothetical protein